MEKETTTKYVLYANALLLLLGTFFETNPTPAKSFELSILFVAWVSVTVWYVYHSVKTQSSD